MGPGFESLKVHNMMEVMCEICGFSKGKSQGKVGVIYAEGPPVPIPNTEVKLCRAEDTWLATARENRYTPTLDRG